MAEQQLTLEPKKTALVLIDLQGAIVTRDTAPYKPFDVITRAAKLADAVRTAGGLVVYVHVLIGEVAHRITDEQRAPMPAQLPPGATEIVPEAGRQPGDILIAKRQWGAFEGTSLDQHLRRKGIDTLIMGGIATNMGVESTARAAQDIGYQLVFAEDAMTSMTAEMHEFSVKNIFPRMGRVRSTEQIITALKAG
ncbi:MAG TPA: isochorismatase family protein [Bryocella sp.]|nr:isochorismatase family protein [Bryocella sp.]